MKLPRIKFTLNSTINNEFFLTDTDDIGFARNQVNQIDYRIRTKHVQDLKPWERFIDNNIYSSLDRKNRFLIKDKKKKIRNNSLSFNWNNQNIFNKSEIDNILKCEEIKKQIKIKYDIKYKYKEPNITVSNFISTRNETFLTNKIINILKEKKNTIQKKQENYEKALKYENKSLDKDIDKFNEFTIRLKKKNEENDLFLLKTITDNKNLVELYKKQLQEYNSTIYEVYKYIKLIGNLKQYAAFIHKLLGGDNEILHYDLIDNINFKEFKNRDISHITKNIIKKTKKIINNDDSDKHLDNNINDDFYLNLDDSMTINNFDLSFKTMEEKIIKKFIEKQRYVSEKEAIIRKENYEEEEKKKKYNEFKKDYDAQKSELDNEIKDYNKIFLTPEEKGMIEYYYELLKDIYNTLFGNLRKAKEFKEIKEFNADNAHDMNKEVVSPILKEIYSKEVKINNLIEIMEENEKENNIVFNKVLTRRKLENRAMKLYNERELMKIKEIMQRKKYNNKMKKIIFKGRYKYNPPITPESNQSKLNRVNKTDMNVSDFNLMIYQ